MVRFERKKSTNKVFFFVKPYDMTWCMQHVVQGKQMLLPVPLMNLNLGLS